MRASTLSCITSSINLGVKVSPGQTLRCCHPAPWPRALSSLGQGICTERRSRRTTLPCTASDIHRSLMTCDCSCANHIVRALNGTVLNLLWHRRHNHHSYLSSPAQVTQTSQSPSSHSNTADFNPLRPSGISVDDGSWSSIDVVFAWTVQGCVPCACEQAR